MKAEQVLTADYSWSDEPLAIDEIDGLRAAVEEVAETHDAAFVPGEGVKNYKVYWNEPTESVRVGIAPVCAAYEVPMDDL